MVVVKMLILPCFRRYFHAEDGAAEEAEDNQEGPHHRASCVTGGVELSKKWSVYTENIPDETCMVVTYACACDVMHGMYGRREQFLINDERLIMSGIVYKRKGLFARKRMLLLTSFPRFVYIDRSRMEKKGGCIGGCVYSTR